MQSAVAAVDMAARNAFDRFFQTLWMNGVATRPRQVYHMHRQWKSFMRIGKLCVDNGWPVGDFVEKAIDMLTDGHTLVLPQDLLRASVVDRYRERRAALVSPSEMWDAAEKSVLAGLAAGHTEHDILLHSWSGLPAWIRIAYPESLQDDILEAWGPIAKDEMGETPEIDRFVRTMAPANHARVMALEDPEPGEA